MSERSSSHARNLHLYLGTSFNNLSKDEIHDMSTVKKWLTFLSKSELQFEEQSVLFLMVICLPLTSLGSWDHNVQYFSGYKCINFFMA